MIHNPWYVGNDARYEHRRIEDEMRQIRLGHHALKARNSARKQPAFVRVVRHATLVMAKAVMAILG